MGLLQNIGQIGRYYAKIAMKLIMVSFAMLRDTFTWFTPLELATCLHLANHCRVSAVTRPSGQEIATIALALFTLSLSLLDWHVPRSVQCQQFICQILTAMSMHAFRMDCACNSPGGDHGSAWRLGSQDYKVVLAPELP